MDLCQLAYDFVFVRSCAFKRLRSTCRIGLCESSSLCTSGFRDVDFTGAAAVGRRGDDVLGGALGVGGLLLLLQLLGVGLRRALGNRLFGLQLGLTLGDHVVRLQEGKENSSVITRCHHDQITTTELWSFCPDGPGTSGKDTPTTLTRYRGFLISGFHCVGRKT